MRTLPTVTVEEPIEDERTVIDDPYGGLGSSGETREESLASERTLLITDPDLYSSPALPFAGLGATASSDGFAKATAQGPLAKLGDDFVRPEPDSVLNLPLMLFRRIEWQRCVTSRSFIRGAAVVLLVSILGFVAYRERQVANALRIAVAATEVEAKRRLDRSPKEHLERNAGTRYADAKAERQALDIHIDAEAALSERVRMESQGADLLVANNYEAALDHYQILVDAFPTEGSFADLVAVLRMKVRCNAGELSTGGSCP